MQFQAFQFAVRRCACSVVVVWCCLCRKGVSNIDVAQAKVEEEVVGCLSVVCAIVDMGIRFVVAVIRGLDRVCDISCCPVLARSGLLVIGSLAAFLFLHQ